jgi:hypothetical protein
LISSPRGLSWFDPQWMERTWTERRWIEHTAGTFAKPSKCKIFIPDVQFQKGARWFLRCLFDVALLESCCALERYETAIEVSNLKKLRMRW